MSVLKRIFVSAFALWVAFALNDRTESPGLRGCHQTSVMTQGALAAHSIPSARKEWQQLISRAPDSGTRGDNGLVFSSFHSASFVEEHLRHNVNSAAAEPVSTDARSAVKDPPAVGYMPHATTRSNLQNADDLTDKLPEFLPELGQPLAFRADRATQFPPEGLRGGMLFPFGESLDAVAPFVEMWASRPMAPSQSPPNPNSSASGTESRRETFPPYSPVNEAAKLMAVFSYLKHIYRATYASEKPAFSHAHVQDFYRRRHYCGSPLFRWNDTADVGIHAAIESCLSSGFYYDLYNGYFEGWDEEARSVTGGGDYAFSTGRSWSKEDGVPEEFYLDALESRGSHDSGGSEEDSEAEEPELPDVVAKVRKKLESEAGQRTGEQAAPVIGASSSRMLNTSGPWVEHRANKSACMA